MKTSTKTAAAVLLSAHAVLIGLSLPHNSVTIDEVVHLPTGLAYWQRGEFWGYHHNPPLMRLVCAFPLLLMDVPIDYGGYIYREHSRLSDSSLGRDFMLLNRKQYMLLFCVARSMTVLFSILGGWFVFRWSVELFGEAGGLLSLALWSLCPNILAHAGLVTTDIGSTVLGFIATFEFWGYLRSPSWRRACRSGVLLGLAIGAKFSFILLPLLWAGIAIVGILTRRLPLRPASGHALLVCLISVAVLNDLYLCEGTGRRLDSFAFHSQTLTKPKVRPYHRFDEFARENRFRGTSLGQIRVPLPEHFVLGFDDQLFDVDTGKYYKYLRGELRNGDGWWYYYLYGLLVKTPVGVFVCGGASVLAFLFRRGRTDFISEMALLIPLAGFVVSISSQTGLQYLRYILPAYPFAFVWVGRVASLSRSPSWRFALAAILLSNAVSVIRVHPHYLAYFNEPSGGPANGLKHLADSNIDWGQGLIALKGWLDQHASGRAIQLAYFGTMYPEVLGIEYEVPPFGPEAVSAWSDPRSVGPVPGLQAVGANYLVGVPFPTPGGTGEQIPVPLNAYTYYRHFKPVATPGWSIYVYDLSLEEVNRVRRELGLPLLSE